MGRYTKNQQPKQNSLQNNRQSPHLQIHKATISFPQNNHYDEEDSNTPVLVYLHSHNKKSVKLELSPKISISEIKSIIEDKIGIKKDRQLLYLNGKNITQYSNIRLQSKSIIHISNSDQICDYGQEIHLKLTIINYISQIQQKIYKKVNFPSTHRVSDFLMNLKKEMRQILSFDKQNIQFYLLESSRLLQKDKTFLQQNVTRQSDIICMITTNQIKTRFINDTKEEILHDISELLGFSDEVQNIPQPKHQEHIVRTHQQIKEHYSNKNTHQEQSLDHTSSQMLPNFKKKKTANSESSSLNDTPNSGLAKKLKSSKKKKELDLQLNLQCQQKSLFQSSQINKQQVKSSEIEAQQAIVEVITDTPKPYIPNVMPVNERRQIRLQMEKLFDSNGSSKAKSLNFNEISEVKEQKKPISPPTQVPRQRQKMRLSMGSRPAFLTQLRNLNFQ